MEREGAGGRAGPRSLGRQHRAPGRRPEMQAPLLTAPCILVFQQGRGFRHHVRGVFSHSFLRACVFLKRANAPFSPHDDILNTRLQIF